LPLPQVVPRLRVELLVVVELLGLLDVLGLGLVVVLGLRGHGAFERGDGRGHIDDLRLARAPELASLAFECQGPEHGKPRLLACVAGAADRSVPVRSIRCRGLVQLRVGEGMPPGCQPKQGSGGSGLAPVLRGNLRKGHGRGESVLPQIAVAERRRAHRPSAVRPELSLDG
jgi:hypothetical protein